MRNFSFGLTNLEGKRVGKMGDSRAFEFKTQVSCGRKLRSGNFFRFGLGQNLRTPLVGEWNKFNLS